MRGVVIVVLVACFWSAGLGPVLAASPTAPHIDGSRLGLIWILPFVGILLSIAILPLAMPQLWHHHFGKVSAAWALLFVVPYAALYGLPSASYEIAYTILAEFVPFIVLLLALFAVTGGIQVTGNLHGSPPMNTALLAIGTVLAGWIGTTGASMLLLRPVMRANDDRRHRAHVFIFFIFLVSNIGGALTPLGDPPLFLGFLQGVGFFWPTIHLFTEMLVCAVVLLAIFFVLDTYWYAREGHMPQDPTPDAPIRIRGAANIVLLLAIVGSVLLSGTWNPGITLTIYHVDIELQNIVRDLLLLAITVISVRFTSRIIRNDNGFVWGPIVEVAKLFAGIFLTIIPAIAILKAGTAGALEPLVSLVSRPDGTPINAWYFWLSGGLSSFLDNAPTYLVFFNLAGGDAAALTGPLAATLAALSCGAVFMGANSYIGNAPNFMVKAVAEAGGVKMPSFFGYMKWSCGILVPVFIVLTFVFFA
jgi:Na+/H+ antiporter NhaD/arsenite permease-like protein